LPSLAWVVRDSLDVFAAFVALGLTFTAISLLASPLDVRVGTLRSISTIPIHEFALIGTGLALSFLVMIGLRRFDLSSLLLSASFIVFLDLDHLPSALGIAQPIRPAHSLVFLAVLLVILNFVFKKPVKVQLTVVASFLGHLAVDTGAFPLLAPLSYAYYSLSSVDLALLGSAALIALLAGYLGRRSHGPTLTPESLTPGAVGPALSAVAILPTRKVYGSAPTSEAKWDEF
jgi:hypothetical protein